MARPSFQGCAFPIMKQLGIGTSSEIAPQPSLLWPEQDNSSNPSSCAIFSPQPSSSPSAGSRHYVSGSLVLGSGDGLSVRGAALTQGQLDTEGWYCLLPQLSSFQARVRIAKYECFYITLHLLKHRGVQHLPGSLQKSARESKQDQRGGVLILNLTS